MKDRITYIITFIEILIAFVYFSQIDLEPDSSAIYLIVVIVCCISLNLVICICFWKINKSISKSFYLNAYIASILILIILLFYSDYKISHKYPTYSFRNSSDNYQLYLNNQYKTFSIDKILNPSGDHHLHVMDGQIISKSDTIMLFGINKKMMYIYDMKLIGFPNQNSKILLDYNH